MAGKVGAGGRETFPFIREAMTLKLGGLDTTCKDVFVTGVLDFINNQETP